jgi:hypothetical protein
MYRPLATLNRKAGAVIGVLAASALAAVAGSDELVRVNGFFCDAKADQIALLTRQAEGENDIMAANAVNKSLARQSCAYYLPLTAIPSGHHTVISGGLVFKLESYIFLPEKVERWSGTAIGSLQPAGAEHNI